MNYLSRLTETQRKEMLAPSKALLALQAFSVSYRKAHPAASMNEVQRAYQLRGAA